MDTIHRMRLRSAIALALGASALGCVVAQHGEVIGAQDTELPDGVASVTLQSVTGAPLFRERTQDSLGISETVSLSQIDPRRLEKNPFFHDLGTNGRTCETCHQAPLGWTITPEFARSLDRSDPLFVFDGSDCLPPGEANAEPRANSTRMLDKALVRIELGIPATADFTLVSFTDPVHCPTAPSASSLRMYRRPLPTANSAFLTTVMWDGRENLSPPNNTPQLVRENLQQQSNAATLGHAQATGNLPAETQLSIVQFETNTFNAQLLIEDLALLSAGANGGASYLYDNTLPAFYVGINDVLDCSLANSCAPGATAIFSNHVFDVFEAWETSPPSPQAAAIGRGEQIFNTKSFSIDDVPGINGPDDTLGLPSPLTGFCGTCHDSPNVGNHSTSLPVNIGVTSEHPLGSLDVNGLPTYTFEQTSTGRTITVTDPGRALVSGKFKDIGKTKGPNLRSLSARAPYFHNGSAKDLNAIVDFYDARFHIGFTAQEKNDLVTFLSAL
jgi:hypothetical protein